WAGLLKIADPAASVTAVRGYQLLPATAAEVVGRVLPTVEVALGAMLVLGLLHRVSGLLSALLQLAFIAGIASVWARGIAIDCGCFGDGGPNPDAFSQYPWEIARDVGLLLLSLFLVRWPRTRLSLDTLLFRPSPRSEEVV
ncbi:MAG: MauE/DoxX family redox-associated membrane protein, partial [Herbiconiux sp.]|nr:MauE/DoxX family redox-associated membrane protein [Herbiconiux sp.]